MSDLEQEVVDVEVAEVIEYEQDGSIDDFPAAAKRALKLAAEMGWQTRTARSILDVPVILIKGGDRAGEVRKAAHRREHIWVAATDPRHRMGFVAAWKRELTDKPKNVFDYARIADPVGQPVELFFDYKPISVNRDPKETEASWEARVRRNQRMCDEQHADYNDGTAHITKEWLAGSATEFTTWLKTWNEMLTKGATA